MQKIKKHIFSLCMLLVFVIAMSVSAVAATETDIAKNVENPIGKNRVQYAVIDAEARKMTKTPTTEMTAAGLEYYEADVTIRMYYNPLDDQNKPTFPWAPTIIFYMDRSTTNDKRGPFGTIGVNLSADATTNAKVIESIFDANFTCEPATDFDRSGNNKGRNMSDVFTRAANGDFTIRGMFDTDESTKIDAGNNQYIETVWHIKNIEGKPGDSFPVRATTWIGSTGIVFAEFNSLTMYDAMGEVTEAKHIGGAITIPGSSTAKHDVVYKYSGDTPSDCKTPPSGGQYDAGNTVTLIRPTTQDNKKDGVIGTWSFNGWTTSDVTLNGNSFKMPSNNVTLTGSWSFTPATTYSLTYKLKDGTEAPSDFVLPTGGDYAAGQVINLPTVPASKVHTNSAGKTGDWRFKGWNASGLDSGNKMPARPVTITGEWEFIEKTEITITFDPTSGSLPSAATNPVKLYSGEALGNKMPTPTHTSDSFKGWYTASTGGTKVEKDTKLYATATLYAQWQPKGGGGGGGGPSTPKTYTLNYVTNGGTDVVKDNKETFNAGTKVDLTSKISTKEGFTLKWYSDKELKNEIKEITMDNDKTVYAGWEKTEVNPDPIGPKPGQNITPPGFISDNHMKYITGYEDGTVRPNRNVSRAEVATMIYNLLKDDLKAEIHATTNDFSDVPENKWYNEFVSSMAKGGYIVGYPDGTFGGDRNITRAEFVTILVKFLDAPISGTINFSDVSTTHWAYSYIVTAVNAGWISGYEDGTYKPNREISRAEAISILNRVLNRNPETIDDILDGFEKFSDNMDSSKWYYLDIIEATNAHDYVRKDNGYEKWEALK